MLKHATLQATDSLDPISQNRNIKILFTSPLKNGTHIFLVEKKK